MGRKDAPLPSEPIGTEQTAIGAVKFWRDDKGHGAIATPDTAPWDVWAHFSHIEAEGYRSLKAGQRVEVRYRRADQDSFKYVAVWVRAMPDDDVVTHTGE